MLYTSKSGNRLLTGQRLFQRFTLRGESTRELGVSGRWVRIEWTSEAEIFPSPFPSYLFCLSEIGAYISKIRAKRVAESVGYILSNPKMNSDYVIASCSSPSRNISQRRRLRTYGILRNCNYYTGSDLLAGTGGLTMSLSSFNLCRQCLWRATWWSLWGLLPG